MPKEKRYSSKKKIDSIPSEETLFKIMKNKTDHKAELTEALTKLGENAKNAIDEDGLTPLHWAVKNSRKSYVKILLEAGFNVEAKDNDGWTPLHYALMSSRLHTFAIIQQFLKRKTNYVEDNKGKTPLDYLFARNAPPNKYFHEVIAKSNLLIEDHENLKFKILKMCLEDNPNLVKGYCDKKGRTLLHLALLGTAYNRYEVIRLLTIRGSDYNIADATNQTPRSLLQDLINRLEKRLTEEFESDEKNNIAVELNKLKELLTLLGTGKPLYSLDINSSNFFSQKQCLFPISSSLINFSPATSSDKPIQSSPQHYIMPCTIQINKPTTEITQNILEEETIMTNEYNLEIDDVVENVLGMGKIG